MRLGTAEFYDVVEDMAEVADSLVVHLEDDQGGSGELLLFVALVPGAELDDDLRTRIASGLRRHLSPRHVPDLIAAVPAVPRTLTGQEARASGQARTARPSGRGGDQPRRGERGGRRAGLPGRLPAVAIAQAGGAGTASRSRPVAGWQLTYS